MSSEIEETGENWATNQGDPPLLLGNKYEEESDINTRTKGFQDYKKRGLLRVPHGTATKSHEVPNPNVNCPTNA